MKYKYIVDVTNEFKKDYKKILKQGKDLDKLKVIVDKLARDQSIDRKYRDHKLADSKKYKNCGNYILNQIGFGYIGLLKMN